MEYFLVEDASLVGDADRIEFNEKPLIVYDLVIALKETIENRSLAGEIETALESMDTQKMITVYMAKQSDE